MKDSGLTMQATETARRVSEDALIRCVFSKLCGKATRDIFVFPFYTYRLYGCYGEALDPQVQPAEAPLRQKPHFLFTNVHITASEEDGEKLKKIVTLYYFLSVLLLILLRRVTAFAE